MRIRNTIFAILFCAFLLGPAAVIFSEQVGIELPGWLSAEDSRYLDGGIAKADVAGNLSPEGFASEELQTALDNEVGNHVPLKFSALLGNAALQRSAIEASNALFNWPCYPAYYGSDKLYDPSLNTLSYMPAKSSEVFTERWRSFAEGVVKTAKRHPDKRFLIYIAQGSDTPSYNAAYELVADALVPQECIDVMTEITKDADNVFVVTKSYDSAEDYFHDYFTTDHHWNIEGAYTAYTQIADTLGLDQISLDGTHQIEGCLYNGAYSRSGLLLLNEKVYDSNKTFSNLVAITEEGAEESLNAHTHFWDGSKLAQDFSFYDRYYDDIPGPITIKGGKGDRKALLVSNSYRGAIQRLLGSSYHELATNTQLHVNTKMKQCLDDQIQSSDADDIIFAACPNSLRISPEYWETGEVEEE